MKREMVLERALKQIISLIKPVSAKTALDFMIVEVADTALKAKK